MVYCCTREQEDFHILNQESGARDGSRSIQETKTIDDHSVHLPVYLPYSYILC